MPRRDGAASRPTARRPTHLRDVEVRREREAEQRRAATYAMTRYVPALIITGPIARPSRPSVRLTAFEVAMTTKIANGT